MPSYGHVDVDRSSQADPLHGLRWGERENPDEDLKVDFEGIGDETDQAPSQGGDRGSWLPIAIWFLVVVAIATFIYWSHHA